MTHDHIEGTPLGKHPLVTRLLKGIYNSRPPQPRYSATWDVDVVIRYLKTMGENDTLSLKQLSQKLALLMALVDASRISELQALDLRYRSYRPEGVVFHMPTLSKKRIVGAPPKQDMFGAFPGDSRLCVIKNLKQYERLTTQHRKKEPGFLQPLFLFYICPSRSSHCSTDRPLVKGNHGEGWSGYCSFQGSLSERCLKHSSLGERGPHRGHFTNCRLEY